MRAHIRAAAVTAAIAGLSTLAHAAPEGGAGTAKQGVIPSIQQGLPTAIVSILVFGIVVLVFSTAVWPKITAALDERASKIRSEINAAEHAREQAKRSLEEYERALAEARSESQRIIDETKAKQADLAAELRAKADRELTEMRDKARRDIEAAKKAAITELYNESVHIAASMASRILEREVSAEDHRKLLDESIEQLEPAGA